MTLKAIYPTKFQSLYPSEETQQLATKLWEYHLKDFSNEVLNQALLECPDRFDWIPDLTDFKKLCRSIDMKINPNRDLIGVFKNLDWVQQRLNKIFKEELRIKPDLNKASRFNEYYQFYRMRNHDEGTFR
ncbi:MAG TPA: hypothetical protein VIH61_05590 [Waddliaceae bacterium]